VLNSLSSRTVARVEPYTSWAGWDVWTPSGPMPLLKAGLKLKLDQIAQGFIQTKFEHIQGWQFHSLSGLNLWQSSLWIFFLRSSWNFHCSILRIFPYRWI